MQKAQVLPASVINAGPYGQQRFARAELNDNSRNGTARILVRLVKRHADAFCSNVSAFSEAFQVYLKRLPFLAHSALLGPRIRIEKFGIIGRPKSVDRNRFVHLV